MQHQISNNNSNEASDDEQRQELILTVNEVDCQDFPYDDVLSLEAAVTETAKNPARRATRRESSSKKSTRSDSSGSNVTILSTQTFPPSSSSSGEGGKGYATRDSPRYYKEQVDPSALSHLSEMQETILLGDNNSQQQMYQFNFNDFPLTVQQPVPPCTSSSQSVMPSIHQRGGNGSGRGMLYELCKTDDEPLTIPTPPPITPGSCYTLESKSSPLGQLTSCGRKESAESLPESCDTHASDSVMDQLLNGYRIKVGGSNQLMKNLSSGTLYAIIEELQEQVVQKSKDLADKDNELNYWKTKAEIFKQKWEQMMANGDKTTQANGRFRVTPERTNSRNNAISNGTRQHVVTQQAKRRRESSQSKQSKRAKTETGSPTTLYPNINTKKPHNNTEQQQKSSKDTGSSSSSSQRVIDPQEVRRALRAVAESRISSKETANSNAAAAAANHHSPPTVAPPLSRALQTPFYNSTAAPTLQIRTSTNNHLPNISSHSAPPFSRSGAPIVASTRSASADDQNVFIPEAFATMTSPSPVASPPEALHHHQQHHRHHDDQDSIFSILHEYNNNNNNAERRHANNSVMYSPSAFSTSSLSSSKWSPFSSSASPLAHDVILQQPSSAEPPSTHHQELLPLTSKKCSSHPNLAMHASLERKESSRSNDGRLMKALGDIMLPDATDDDDDVPDADDDDGDVTMGV